MNQNKSFDSPTEPKIRDVHNNSKSKTRNYLEEKRSTYTSD